MNERIKEIAILCPDVAEQIPFFRGIQNGLTWEATIMKARDLKFAELIVRECVAIVWNDKDQKRILKHFGIKE